MMCMSLIYVSLNLFYVMKFLHSVKNIAFSSGIKLYVKFTCPMPVFFFSSVSELLRDRNCTR